MSVSPSLSGHQAENTDTGQSITTFVRIVWKGTETLWTAIYQTERLSFINKPCSSVSVACCYNVITMGLSIMCRGSQSARYCEGVASWECNIRPWWQPSTLFRHIIRDPRLASIIEQFSSQSVMTEMLSPWPRLIMHCLSPRHLARSGGRCLSVCPGGWSLVMLLIITRVASCSHCSNQHAAQPREGKWNSVRRE